MTIDDVVCMCICELAEAVKEWRNGRPNYYHLCGPSDVKKHICDLDCGGTCSIAHGDPCQYRDPKPEGVAVELANCVLRLLDYLATTDVDIDAKLGFVLSHDTIPLLVCYCAYHLTKSLTYDVDRRGVRIEGMNDLFCCINVIRDWFATNNIDLESILREKHEYNKTRPYRHGDKLV